MNKASLMLPTSTGEQVKMVYLFTAQCLWRRNHPDLNKNLTTVINKSRSWSSPHCKDFSHRHWISLKTPDNYVLREKMLRDEHDYTAALDFRIDAPANCGYLHSKLP